MQDISKPIHPDAIILWRYMNTDKFIELLHSEFLHLTQSNYFEDAYEGLLTLAEATSMHRGKSLPADNLVRFASYQKSAYISAWHKNNYESYAMWKLYAGRNEGIAIQTTYKDLLECSMAPEANKFCLGEVNYIDFFANREVEIGLNRATDPLNLLLRKDFSFKYENEVRIIRVVDQYQDAPQIKLQVDVCKLMKKIYVNPYAPMWYYKSIQFLIKEYSPPRMREKLLTRLQPRKLNTFSDYTHAIQLSLQN